MSSRPGLTPATIRRAAGLALALALVLAAGCGAAGNGAPVSLVLNAVDGGDLALTTHRGKVVVLHLFTTWSLDANRDLPQLEEAARRDDTVVIGVILDLEGFRVALPWRKVAQVHYALALAGDELREGRTSLGKIDVVPTTVVLDRAGRPVARVTRPLADGELARLVRQAASSR